MILCVKDRNLEWTKEPFSIHVLGITFTTHLEDMEPLNFEPKLLQIERDIKSWSKRHIIPLGKITVIKSLLLPKLTHLFIALPRPSEQWIKNFKKPYLISYGITKMIEFLGKIWLKHLQRVDAI